MRTALTFSIIFTIALTACSSSPPEADGGHVRPRDMARPDTGQDASQDISLDTGRDLPLDLAADLTPCTLLGVYSSKNPACNQCAEDKCCAELNGCFAEPLCDDFYVNCMLACVLAPDPDAGVSTCLSKCAADYPLGLEKYQIAMGCPESSCAGECS